jgi:hypothetical protein
MKKYFIYCIVASFFISSKSFPRSDRFNEYNQKINYTENQIIKDFYFTVPKNYSKNYKKENHLSLAKILELRYKEQILNFKSVVSDLAVLRKGINTNQENLNEGEYSTLIASIDYSLIILQSRKEEIYKSYHDFKKKLGHNLSLKEFFIKLKEVKLPGKCHLAKVNFNKLKDQLTFSINQFNKVGQVESTQFIIHKDDLQNNQIHAQYDNSANKPNIKVLRTQFNLAREDSKAKHFNFVESSNGEVKYAKFHYEDTNKSFLSSYGISWGESKEEKQIVCDPSEVARLPASINN